MPGRPRRLPGAPTGRQLVLDYLRDHGRVSKTIRAMNADVGFGDHTTLFRHLQRLERDGCVRRLYPRGPGTALLEWEYVHD